MSQADNESTDRVGALGRLYRWIAGGSMYAAFACLVIMMVVMVLEVALRYFANSPLGWNISLIEKVLLPGIVFLGLPWAYTVGAHITADMLYDRLPSSVRKGCRILGVVLLGLGATLLMIAGGKMALESLALGSVPPPLSSQIKVHSWLWQAFLPVGAGFMLLLVLIDARKVIRDDSRSIPGEGITA